MSDERLETVSDIISEMRMALKPFPYVYSIGRRDAPAEFDADGLMIKPQSIVIEDVTVPVLCSRLDVAYKRERKAMLEALRMVKKMFDGRIMWQHSIRRVYEAVKAALALAEGGAR